MAMLGMAPSQNGKTSPIQRGCQGALRDLLDLEAQRKEWRFLGHRPEWWAIRQTIGGYGERQDLHRHVCDLSNARILVVQAGSTSKARGRSIGLSYRKRCWHGDGISRAVAAPLNANPFDGRHKSAPAYPIS
jgi:hypothetical protein